MVQTTSASWRQLGGTGVTWRQCDGKVRPQLAAIMFLLGGTLAAVGVTWRHLAANGGTFPVPPQIAETLEFIFLIRTPLALCILFYFTLRRKINLKSNITAF
jgi:hypothetical protein